MAKANATLFFADGKTLDVTETVAAIEQMRVDGAATRWCATVTKSSSSVPVWVNLSHVCRIEPA